MRKFKLVTSDNKILYEGIHPTLSQTIEYAVTHNINLHGIDLSDSDLQHINLDGVHISNANFKGANLSGANMSEAEFRECDFSGADLKNACLCYSNLFKCNFKYTILSGVDISMTSLILYDFQGFSGLQLDYHKAFKLESLTFTHFENTIPFSSSPTVIKQGDKYTVIINKAMFYNDIPHTFVRGSTPKSIQNPPFLKIQSMVDFK